MGKCIWKVTVMSPFMSAYMSVYHIVCVMLAEQEEGIRSLGTRVRDG